MAAPLHLSTAEILLLLKVRAGMSLTYAVAVATVVIVAAQQSSRMIQTKPGHPGQQSPRLIT
jgi:hypothetical protein